MSAVTVNAREVDAVIRRAKRYLNPGDLLKAIGLRHLRWINDNFRAGGLDPKWKPLSPNTVATRRGSGAQPLRDTGRLAQSFTESVQGDTVSIGTQMRIAEFHHEGTKPYQIRPNSRRVLRFRTAAGLRYARKVNHPGLPARRLLPKKEASEKMATDIVLAAVEKIDG